MTESVRSCQFKRPDIVFAYANAFMAKNHSDEIKPLQER